MRTLLGCAVAVLALSPAWARLPGTLNFRDETATRIVPAVPEDPDNEKEVELGDFDNDGDLDVVIAAGFGSGFPRRNKLYRNDGGILVEVSGAPVIAGFADRDLSRNAFLRDYDGDGWRDLIIINDSLAGGQAGTTKYYANAHPGGVFSHFEDQTFRLNGAGGAACGGVSLDVDDDGWVDLYLGNYPAPSQDTLYRNDGTGQFVEVTGARVPADGDYTVDVSSADLNGDLLPDLLVSNHFDPNFAYYNDGAGLGDGAGDFSFPGSTQLLSPGSVLKTAMEPGDFDGDGRIDVYYSNRSSSVDQVLHNLGNDAAGNATFEAVDVPGPASQFESRKATVADLNDDGRPDVIVMFPGRRPAILRNTSVEGAISFVDWTPAPAFPAGVGHAGWHSAALDLDGDGLLDLLLGASSGDHAFVNVPSVEASEDALGGVLPGLFNLDPVAVRGEGEAAVPDSYAVSGVPPDASLSTVLRGCGDLRLDLRDVSGNAVASSDRGGIGVEEALQAAFGGTVRLEVTVVRACGDSDGDGDLDRADAEALLACGPGPASEGCRLFDYNLDGSLGPGDVRAFRRRLRGGGVASSPYLLEALARDP